MATTSGMTQRGDPEPSVARRRPSMVELALTDRLVFRPAPPGDISADGDDRLHLPTVTEDVDVSDADFKILLGSLRNGALSGSEVLTVLDSIGTPDNLKDSILDACGDSVDDTWEDELEMSHDLDRLGLAAVKLIDRSQAAILRVEPLSEIQFRLTHAARAVLALGWEAITKRGKFPLRPKGAARFAELQRSPCGALHFVSASDLDAGYLYTMGIAQSPEAQALESMDVSFGLDGELIVPGQAVSPIPPFLALATRLFAASIATSSNISEEVQSIPMRNFAHPTTIDDLEPLRGGRLKPSSRPRNRDEAVTDLRLQLSRHFREQRRQDSDRQGFGVEATGPNEVPLVGAAFDVTGFVRRKIVQTLAPVLGDEVLGRHRELITLYLDVEPLSGDRVPIIAEAIGAAKDLGLRYVAVADDVEDAWLPSLLEYLEPDELDAVADLADQEGVIVIDGRPVDPVYTAATAAQRIQSVFSTLAVDILKMGMWLCLDALTARKVWREIVSNPHFPRQMLLMPIGIVEPWSAFVDNRDPDRTPRPILDPFEKIKFIIEEAAELGIPSLLTDTRHKETWVLLGRKTKEDEPHVRERFVADPETGDILGRAPDSAIPLLSWKEFMECERFARKEGILLGQAGSVEMDQLFRIISETTFDAAKDGKNPATAVWTAETERVLRTGTGGGADLHSQRSSDISAFLAVRNRAEESHAKVDGWLRFLAEVGQGDPALRQDLENRRGELQELLERCLASQRHDPSRYQRDWDAFRDEFVEYHSLIKDNFRRIRDQVAASWVAL